MNSLYPQGSLNGKIEKAKMAKVTPVISEYIDPHRGIPYVEYQTHINRYIFAANFVQNKVVLDVACGSATGSTYLAIKGAKTVVGLDVSQEALRDARRWNKGKEKVALILSDAQALPFADNSFDVIVSFETIEHLKELEKFLAECRRVLRKRGIFICSTPNKKVHSPLFRKPVNPYHIREFFPEEFYDLLGKYFIDVKAYGQQQLNLGQRIKLQVVYTIAHIIFTVFKTDRICNFFYRLYRLASREPYVSRFRENIDEMVDRNYGVIPIKDNLFKTPETILAVAKGKD